MKAFRIEITAETASFRHPTVVTAYQPTLPLPPISTIYGIISAVTGSWVEPGQFKLAYVFHGKSKFYDLETTYKTEGKYSKGIMKVEPDIIHREIYFKPRLFIYLRDEELFLNFKKPHYPILLGRSGDLACVNNRDEVELIECSDCSLYGTAIPYEPGSRPLPGLLQSLPVYFKNTYPRTPERIQPYLLINEPSQYFEKSYHDPNLHKLLGIKEKIGLFFHES